MARDVLHELVSSGVSHQETLHVIISHFGGAQSTPNHEVDVPRDGPHALRIRSKGDQIVEIKVGPALDAQDIPQLKKKIHDKLVNSQDSFVAAHVFFSTHPINGSYRCSDPKVQFLSAPDAAPRPPFVAGEHPFVVEFPCTRSSDVMITVKRRMAQVKLWSHVLNVVLAPRITPLESRGQWSWVLVDGEPPQEFRFAQHGYSVPELRNERDDFSPALGRLTETPHDAYYMSHPPLYGDQFAIPDSLGETLNRIFSLPKDASARFFRAAHWLFTAGATWQDSASAAFISTIAAFESLIPRPKPGTPCTECGKDTSPGPTRLFRQFLDTYVPSTEGMRNVADRLYTVRSNLAHGEYMLLSDVEPFGAFDSEWLREFETRGHLHAVSRIAILNWLYGQEFS